MTPDSFGLPAAPAAPLDTARARATMVDGYLRPNKVTDTRVLDAMRDLPRERFLPAGLAGLAYLDEDVPLGGGRVLLDPLIAARLVQLCRPAAGGRALVVASGSGYLSAVLARTGMQVTALEEEERLLDLARRACAQHAPSVRFRQGPLGAGDAQGAPFDVIIVEGAVPAVPEALGAQLGAGGRLSAVVADRNGCRGMLAEAVGGSLRARPAFDCSTPVLPQLRPAPGFVF